MPIAPDLLTAREEAQRRPALGTLLGQGRRACGGNGGGHDTTPSPSHLHKWWGGLVAPPLSRCYECIERPKGKANSPPDGIGQCDQTSTIASEVEEGVLKRKYPTCSNWKAKVGEAKECRVNKESQPNLGNVVSDGIGTSSVSEKGTFVVGRSGSRECSKGSHIPTDSAKEMEEGASFDTSTQEADASATSFHGGPSDLSLLLFFTNHVLLDILRNKGVSPVHAIAFYHGPMKFMDIVEPHNPIKFWEDWEGDLESVERCSEKADYPYQTSSDYMEWYLRFTYLTYMQQRNRRALNVAFSFRCTLEVNLTLDDAFQMVYQVIAILSSAEHTYQSTTMTASQSKGGTTSTRDVLHYD
ncbi:hypothetical protein Syun_018642 [Stephania yunnanensis]|uniref:Uncharacterized protein n=1 Tax=Stephania yunnanensis TaxID=152371 RepID=A0AAP0ITA2_9MAGN